MATEEKISTEIIDVEAKSSEVRGQGGARYFALEFAKGVFYALIGALVGRCELPFGAFPFGIAFLCAADRKVIYIFLGVCGSALLFSERPILLVCAYSAVMLVRVISRFALDPLPLDLEEHRFGDSMDLIFSENFLLRMASAAVGAFIVGLYLLMESGFLYYHLYGALLSVICAPLAVFVIYGIFNRSGVHGKLYYVASAAIAIGAVLGARGLEIYGVSLSAFIAMSAVLYVTAKKGIAMGISAGVVCGMAYSLLYSPVFVFAAIMYGALRRVSSFFAAVAAFAAGISWGVYVGGVGAISTLLSALLSAALIIAVVDKLFLSAEDSSEESAQEEIDSVIEETVEERSVCAVSGESVSELRVRDMEDGLQSLRGAFSELSGLFFDIGERMKKPLASDIRQISESAFDACCGNCRSRERCWEENYTEMMSAVNSISAEIHRNGTLSPERIPEMLRRSCERIGDITDEIEHNASRHMQELLLFDKSEIFALDYEAIAELIASTTKVGAGEYSLDLELSEVLAGELAEQVEYIVSIAVCGKDSKKALVSFPSADAFEEVSAEVLEGISRALGIDVCVERSWESGGVFRCLYAPRAIYAVEYAKASRRASEEESYCGDTVNVFSIGEEKLYSLISDGMGSGADAALSSRICAVFMEKMLRAGNKCRTTLKMLNGFLRNKGGGSLHECSATIDLLEIDLVRGVARFYKSGAAPTYVFRGGELFKLSAKTLPLGIMRDIDNKKLRFEIKEGDVIIMVSDGVTQSREECPWLYGLLRKALDAEGINKTVEMIIQRAERECGTDDISVVALKIAQVK